MSEVIDNDTQQVLPGVPTVAAGSALQTMAENAAYSIDALLNKAMGNGASEALVMRLLDMKQADDAAKRKQAYDEAFAKFKSKCVRVIRSTTYADGPLKGKKYADLADVVATATEHLSEFGLSSSWEPVVLPDANPKEWVQLACVLRHVGGHEERVEFGGPIDTGPGRSAIQARKSTVSYLERITFLLVCGLAEADADDDGAGGPQETAQTSLLKKLIAEAQATNTDADALAYWRANANQLASWPYGYQQFRDAVGAHRASMQKAVPA